MPDDTDKENKQIYVMNTDGSDIRQLTYFENDEAAQPSWSPDGEHIVFSTSLNNTSEGMSLYIMTADGTNLHPMKDRPDTNVPVLGSNARWSPDGTKVAYDFCIDCNAFGRNTEIFVYDFETDSVFQITDHPAGDSHPTWGPDSQKLAFVSHRDYYNADTLRYRSDLYSVNIDGAGLTRLTENGYTNSPTWVLNSDVIVFRNSSVPNGLLEVNINTKQTHKIDLSLTKDAIYYPLKVSPDYSKLLLYRYGYSSPHDNSILIWNLYKDSYKSIFSKSISKANQVISGADWYYPKSN